MSVLLLARSAGTPGAVTARRRAGLLRALSAAIPRRRTAARPRRRPAPTRACAPARSASRHAYPARSMAERSDAEGAATARPGADAPASLPALDIYRSLFEHTINGLAFHEVVLDAEGCPIDYVFLEVNAAFEKQTGLRRESILGRRVTEVLPGIERDAADWIGRYGRVALTGESIRFQQFSATLGRWYDVAAFSPARGYFAVVFSDVDGAQAARGRPARERAAVSGPVERAERGPEHDARAARAARQAHAFPDGERRLRARLRAPQGGADRPRALRVLPERGERAHLPARRRDGRALLRRRRSRSSSPTSPSAASPTGTGPWSP